ncbi:MAG: ATP-binding cassette domain-containing protein [Chloroflexi bacterium]|nr:MAG: ATP-binding cassette domain-containing protein [Chloroflexota bacterium]
MAALSFEDVRYRYPDGSSPALDGITLAVEEGQMVLLLGESGCGKSTLLRAALGLVPHFHGGRLSGRVVSGGLDTREHRPGAIARRAGLVFQDPESQLVMRRADHEVAFGLENLGCPPVEMTTRLEEALAAAGASHLAERETARMSGGEQQRADQPARPGGCRGAAGAGHAHQPRPWGDRGGGRAPHRAHLRRGRPRDRDGDGTDLVRRHTGRGCPAPGDGRALAVAAGDTGLRGRRTAGAAALGPRGAGACDGEHDPATGAPGNTRTGCGRRQPAQAIRPYRGAAGGDDRLRRGQGDRPARRQRGRQDDPGSDRRPACQTGCRPGAR